MELKVFLTALICMCVITKGNSLKCFECTTQVDDNSPCVDPSKGKERLTTEDCSEGEVCAVYTYKSPNLGVSTLSRSCEPKDVCHNLPSHGKLGKLEDCHVCETDLCSSGRTVELSVLMIAASWALMLFMI